MSYVLLALTLLFVNIYGDSRSKFESLSDIEYNMLAQEPVYVANDSVHWMEFAPGVWTKLYYAEPVTGKFVTLMKASPGTFIGTHRHYGTVLGYTLQGKWGYIEHEKEWLAKKGDLVFETPGSVHTLFVAKDSDVDVLILFIMDGGLEFLDNEGNSVGYIDWRTQVRAYYDYCKQKNIVPYDVTNPRGKAPEAIISEITHVQREANRKEL